MYDIRYLPIAKQDITDIIMYISGHLNAPQAAMELLDSLDRSISLLSKFPYAHKLFHPLKPLEEEHRMLPVKNYVVFYVVREQAKVIEIQRIIFGRMDLIYLLR